MPRITEEKLYSPFKRVEIMGMEYVSKAKDIALRIQKGEIVSQAEIAYIRLAATDDRINLKGDFVINSYLDAYSTFERWEKGKSLKATDNLIKAIFKNGYKTPTENIPVKEFCEVAGISVSKYYRILHKKVKNEETKVRLDLLEAEVLNESNAE